MIFFLEIISFTLGLYIIYRELIFGKFKNFIPSVFILFYVPLFSFLPLIYDLLIGGALSINKKEIDFIFLSKDIYIIYHIYNIGFLLVFILLSNSIKINRNQSKINLKTSTSEYVVYTLVLSTGLYLYIYSTGLSFFELLIADRFSWFNNSNYSSFFSVITSYLVSTTPVIVFMMTKNKKFSFLTIVIIILFTYGILSKDRKWIIFLISGLFAAKYYLDKKKIKLSAKLIIVGSFFIVSMIFWQVLRDVLFTELVTGRGDFTYYAREMAENLIVKGDLSYYYFSSMTAINLNFYNDFNIPFGIIRRLLFFFLPVGYSFGLKIKDISAIFSDELDAGDLTRSGNMPPGFIGLFVLSFNWWGGIIIFLLVPFGIFFLEKLLRESNNVFLKIILYSNFFSFTILLLRGDDSSAFYFMIFNFLMLYIINIFSRLKLFVEK